MSQKLIVAVPRELKIDQICALFVRLVVELQQVTNLMTASFAEVMAHTQLLFRDNDDTELPAGAIQVDWTPYNQLSEQFASATGAQAAIGKIDDLEDFQYLVSLLDANNAEGVLVKGPESLAKMLRRIYELDRGAFRSLYGDPAAQDFDTFRCRVLALYWPLIQLFFRAANVDLAAVKVIENPFSTNGMLMMLGIVGEQGGDMIANFQHAEELVAARMERAESKVRKAWETARQFNVPANDGSVVNGWFIETDDRLVPGLFLEQHRAQTGVLIVKRTDDSGRYTIFTTGQQDLTFLQAELTRREPVAEWYLFHKAPQSAMLLNGSASRAATPSMLGSSVVIRLVQDHVMYQKPARRDDAAKFNREGRGRRTPSRSGSY